MPENDQLRLLGASEDAERDIEAHGSEHIAGVNGGGGGGSGSGKGLRDMLKLSGHHRHSFKRLERERERERDRVVDSNNVRDSSHSEFDLHSFDSSGDVLADSAPPEWALLLLGCLLGLATGLLVAVFNKGVCLFSIFDNVLFFGFLCRTNLVLFVFVLKINV